MSALLLFCKFSFVSLYFNKRIGLDFNNGFCIQVIPTGHGTWTYPVAFQSVVWPVLAGHYQSNMAIQLKYDLTKVVSYDENVAGSYYGNTVVMGF